jgi:Tfp pilus assembly protein PilF
LALLDQAIEIDPNFASAFAERSLLLDWMGAVERSSQDLATALALDPGLGIAHARMGEKFLHQTRGADARREFEIAARLSPNDARVLSPYAFFLAVVGEHENALRLAARAAELDPRAPFNFENLSAINLLIGDTEIAIAAALKAIEIDPAYQAPYTLLGRVEAGRGNQDQAVAYLRQAEELGIVSTAGRFTIAFGYALAGLPGEVGRLVPDELPQRPDILALALGDSDPMFALIRGNFERGEARRFNWLFIANTYNHPLLDRPDLTEFNERTVAQLREE